MTNFFFFYKDYKNDNQTVIEIVCIGQFGLNTSDLLNQLHKTFFICNFNIIYIYIKK